MPTPQLKTIASDLKARIDAVLFGSATYLDPNGLPFRSLEREAHKLIGVDAVDGWLHLGMVHQLAGQIDEVARCTANLRKLRPGFWLIEDLEIVAYANVGLYSKSAAALARQPYDDFAVAGYHDLAVLVGALEWLRKGSEGMRLAEPDGAKDWLELAERIRMTLHRNGISEQHLQAVLDVAGEVLRSRRLFHANTGPVVRCSGDAVLYQIRVGVPADEAARLTLEVIDRMIDQDLDAPGLYFSFISAT